MRFLWVALAAAALPLSAAAQEVAGSPGKERPPSALEFMPKVLEMADRGFDIYRYDRSTMRAIHALEAEVGERSADRAQGYYVLPSESGRAKLVVTFYGAIGGKNVDFARYEVEDDRVTGGGIIPERERREVSPLAQRLIDATRIVREEAARKRFGLCTRARPSIIVLPPDRDNVVSAYAMTTPDGPGVFPMGGHYRVDIAADGTVQSRKLADGCLNVTAAELGERGIVDGGREIPLIVPHSTDDYPPETYFFSSYYLPIEFRVVTYSSDQLWTISNGRFVSSMTFTDWKAQIAAGN